MTRSLILGLLVLACGLSAEEVVRFPDDAGVIDLSKDPYNLTGDGKTDCSDVIQKALDDYAAKNRILYLPAGTYLVSETLEWGPSKRTNPDLDTKWAAYNRHRMTILQGETESKTIIKLMDNAPKFQTTGWDKKNERPMGKAVVWTGGYPAQRFRNAVRNVTIDTGTGNPGAIGIQFNASNQGTMHRVTVRSGDGQGVIGIDLGHCGDHGPGAGRHLTVEGFDHGVWSASMNSMTLWDLHLKNQNKAGIRILSEELWLSDVVSENSVPVLEMGTRWGSWGTIIGGKFTGGDPANPAIKILGNVKDRHLFVRDLEVAGYGKTVAVVKDSKKDVTGNIDEWSLRGGKALFAGDSLRTLRLPVKKSPDMFMPKPGKDWANVTTFGAKGSDFNAKGDQRFDDTAGFQAALDSGASTIYIPAGRMWNVKDLTIPASVERIIGCEAYLNGDTWTIEQGKRPVILERWHPWWNKGRNITVDIKGPRTVVLRDVTGLKIHQYSTGDLFVEDVVGLLFLHGKGTKAWCRYLNYEPNEEMAIINDGGDLWIHGGKTEHSGAKIQLINGSRTEFFGSFWYASFGNNTGPGAEVIDSTAVFAVHRMHSFNKGTWKPFLKATQNGETVNWGDWAIDWIAIGTGE
ncbi:MAG: glycosyl hydrolase family 28-related protein [Planctomycetota bacterium]|jgi:hypothetical protein|nr:glycosyl hydrolase family 28-related protein [Planctomycetota bacterium]